jgi:hypothetical protein
MWLLFQNGDPHGVQPYAHPAALSTTNAPAAPPQPYTSELPRGRWSMMAREFEDHTAWMMNAVRQAQ